MLASTPASVSVAVVVVTTATAAELAVGGGDGAVEGAAKVTEECCATFWRAAAKVMPAAPAVAATVSSCGSPGKDGENIVAEDGSSTSFSSPLSSSV